jgi:hypothetical protein
LQNIVDEVLLLFTMKKTFYILFSMLILLSGMHLSVATHLCGGEIAAVKWSVTGEKATCGMENSRYKNSVNGAITSNCCQDDIAVYTVDNNYNFSNFQIKKAVTNLLQVFSIPLGISTHSFIPLKSLYTSISPRDKLQISAVSLENICVFRI